ncbi:mitoferrin-2 isoform X2 [Taeniopygia guttata]|uniref:mitoferrin-2 isoform X2 n=1 Tax=Taeniopygia guttata TaxID=59729 RepID=UPI003BB939C5
MPVDSSCLQTSWDWPWPVRWQCQSSPQECHMVSEPVSPWCPLLDSRTRHSRGSTGLRGEQGVFRPRQAHRGVPAGHGNTRHPKASLPAGGIGLSPKEQAQMSPSHPMAHGSLSQSSPCLSHSGGEPLRTSLPFGREMEATFRSHLFQGPPPAPWPGTWGCGGVPGSLTFPPLTCGSSCFAGAAGCVATLLHDAAMNPAEVVKQRMQMYNSPYQHVMDCVRAVWHNEGAGAFYRSYTTQLTMNIPFQAIHFMTYEFLQEQLNPHRQYNPGSHVVSGACAGAVAAAATTPLDVCKTLLNTQESLALSSNISGHITGMANAFRTVYQVGGVTAYFRGVQARVIFQMPSTAIAWSVYEFFKYILTKRQEERRAGK